MELFRIFEGVGEVLIDRLCFSFFIVVAKGVIFGGLRGVFGSWVFFVNFLYVNNCLVYGIVYIFKVMF